MDHSKVDFIELTGRPGKNVVSKNTANSGLGRFRCTIRRFATMIEIVLILCQVVVLCIDWNDSCHETIHIWLLVCLLYRVGAWIFSWTFIEPCLIYLRNDREDIVSSEDYNETNSSCLSSLCFCWVIPWIWVIENDMFLLAWTIIGTIFVVNSWDECLSSNKNGLTSTSSNNSNIEMNSIFLFITVVGVLLLSYILWIVQAFISISSYICPVKLRLIMRKFNIGGSGGNSNNSNGNNNISRLDTRTSSYFYTNGNYNGNTGRSQFTSLLETNGLNEYQNFDGIDGIDGNGGMANTYKKDTNIETTMTMTYEDTTATHTYFIDDGNEASVIYSRNIDQLYDTIDYTQETRDIRDIREVKDIRETAREIEDSQLENNNSKDRKQIKLAINTPLENSKFNKLTRKVYTDDGLATETLPTPISSAPISKIQIDHVSNDHTDNNNDLHDDHDHEISSIVCSSREIILTSNENLLLDEIHETKQNNANNNNSLNTIQNNRNSSKNKNSNNKNHNININMNNNNGKLAMQDLNGVPLNYYENIFNIVLDSMSGLSNLPLQSLFRRVTLSAIDANATNRMKDTRSNTIPINNNNNPNNKDKGKGGKRGKKFGKGKGKDKTGGGGGQLTPQGVGAVTTGPQLLLTPPLTGKVMKPIDLTGINNNNNNGIGVGTSSGAASNLWQNDLKRYSHIGESFVGDNGFDYCSLCQYRYKEKDKLILLPCLHQFHEKCANKWFKQHSLCPICKTVI